MLLRVGFAAYIELERPFEPKLPPEDIREVYLVACGPYVKIGIAANMNSRFASIQANNPYRCEIVKTIETAYASEIESHLHHVLAHRCSRGEWFLMDEENLVVVQCYLDYLEDWEYTLLPEESCPA